MENFANNPQTQLSGSITAGAASFSVVSTVGFSQSGTFTLVISQSGGGNAEIVRVQSGGVSSNTFSQLIRGDEGTTAVSHSSGELVVEVLSRRALLASPGPMTAKGDLTTLNATADATRVVVGSDLQVLTASGGLPIYSLVTSGSIASGQISQFHLGFGAGSSGQVITNQGTSAEPIWAAGGTSLTSGAVQSGFVASGAVQGFFGATRHVASGTVGVFDFGSGAVVAGSVGSGAIVSGNIASGQIGLYHIVSGLISGVILSGSIGSGQIGNIHLQSGMRISGLILSGGIGSGQIGQYHLDFGTGTSGQVLTNQGTSTEPVWAAGSAGVVSGSVTGFFGATRDIQSGTVGVFDLGSGAVIAGTVGSGAIQSGNIASGQIGLFHFVSGLQISGIVNSGGIGSGQVGFGHLANASVQSGTVASGQIAQFHLASGAVNSGQINTTAGAPSATTFLAGNFTWATPTATVGSGGVGITTFGSGAADRFVAPVVSGLTTPNVLITEEAISGVRAVSLSQSGNLRTAMASVSGRMPAVGIVFDNVASGLQTTAYTIGSFQFSDAGSGKTCDFSGYLSQLLFVGRSGQIVTASGAWNSGGLLSGDIVQPLGFVQNSGGVLLEAGAQLPFVPGQIISGGIASGVLGTYEHSSGCTVARAQFLTPIYSGTSWTVLTTESVSGVKAVCLNQSGLVQIAMASVSGRMPAIGVVVDNVLSGIQANVYTDGVIQFTSGLFTAINFFGQPVWVGRSGHLCPMSGSFSSGGWASGDIGQKMGICMALGSGGVFLRTDLTNWSGGPLGEATGGVI